MNYETIINSNLNKFKENAGFSKTNDNEIFEIYINQLFAKKYKYFNCMNEYERFDLTNVGGGDDSGIDGIFIRVNGAFVYSISDIDSIVKNVNSIEIEFIFVQSKNKTSIDTGEMLKFFSGIKNFISDNQIDLVNDKIEEWIDLKNYLYSDNLLSLLKKQPKLIAIYAYKGANINDEHVMAKQSEFINDIENMKCSCSAEVHIFDGEKIFKLIDDVKGNFDKTIPYSDSFELKDSENVNSSIVLLCKANDLLTLLVDDEKQLRKELFNDNVRDYQGETVVNKEILTTIKEDPSKFCLYNNGITIVCKSCNSNNRKISLNCPQIVNGCQTCNTLYKAYKDGIDMSDIDIIVKVISTENSIVMNSIIKGTNRQNVVYDESFEITREFHKIFEEYTNSIQSEKFSDRIYYERRSNQFVSSINVDRKNIFNLRFLIQSYVSTFLLSAYRGFEHEIDLLNKYKGKIFNDKDNCKPYYTSALLGLKMDILFKENYDEYRFYGKFRCLLMSIFIHIISGRVPDLYNERAVNEYCDKLIDTINNELLFKTKVQETIKKFDAIKNKWIESKGEKYSHSIKDSSKFNIFMLEELGFKYDNLIQNSKHDDEVSIGIVTTVKKDRNGFYYCFIKAEPSDVFAHADDNPKTKFATLIGKEVKFKIISYNMAGEPKGKILNVLPPKTK